MNTPVFEAGLSDNQKIRVIDSWRHYVLETSLSDHHKIRVNDSWTQ